MKKERKLTLAMISLAFFSGANEILNSHIDDRK